MWYDGDGRGYYGQSSTTREAFFGAFGVWSGLVGYLKDVEFGTEVRIPCAFMVLMSGM